MKAKKKEKTAVGPFGQKKHLLAELIHSNLALLNLFAREVGVGSTLMKLLHEFLHADANGVCLSDLAKRLGVTPALVTRQVQELEGKGWIQRHDDARDKRRSFIFLSGKGQNEVMKLHERVHLFEARLTVDMDPKELAVATRVLVLLNEKLRSWQGTGRYLLAAEPSDDQTDLTQRR